MNHRNYDRLMRKMSQDDREWDKECHKMTRFKSNLWIGEVKNGPLNNKIIGQDT